MAKKIPVKRKAVAAKGKQRRTRMEADDEAAEKQLEEMAKPTGIKADTSGLRKDEITTKEIVNVLADEIQEIYDESGFRIDRVNAEDKARTLLIELRCHAPTVRISEFEFDVPDCGRH